MARRSLRLQQRWAVVLPHAGDFDPRCLRELGKIYGTAREAQIPLAVDAGDLELAGLPAEPPPSLLDLFLGLARLAYRWGRDDARMRVHYVNSLLYAATEKDDPSDLEERRELADLLAAEEVIEKIPTSSTLWPGIISGSPADCKGKGSPSRTICTPPTSGSRAPAMSSGATAISAATATTSV